MANIIGKWVTTTKEITSGNNVIKAGSRVNIIRCTELGYDVITANCRKATECGYDFYDKNSVSDDKDPPIDVHIEHLQELGILRPNATKQEEAIRKILENCKTADGKYDEFKMSRLLHDLWTGNKTIKQFIDKYGKE